MLYGAVVRDLLLRLAIKDVIRPRWSSAILTELTNALRDRSDLDAAKTNRLAALMENSFPNARITFSDEDLARVPASVDSGDRHVVAA
ncbi:MAG: PIN domain-containing protein, partial [Tepidiformaceae bacterium]